MKNQYTSYYKNRSIKELQEVLNNPNSYEDEARLTAFQILQQKNIEVTPEQVAEMKEVESTLGKQLKELQEKELILQESQEIQEWYSPAAVLGFSIFLSPLLGALLLSYNLKKANKKNQAIYVILLGILFFAIGIVLLATGNMTRVTSIAIGVIPALIFIELFWKKHLGYQAEYKRKPIWKALIIVLAITVFLLALQNYIDPEAFQEIIKKQTR